MNVSEQFFPYTIEFEKISGFISGLWLYDFWFYDTNDFDRVTSYLMLMKKKLECKDHQIYSKMLSKICKKKV